MDSNDFEWAMTLRDFLKTWTIDSVLNNCEEIFHWRYSSTEEEIMTCYFYKPLTSKSLCLPLQTPHPPHCTVFLLSSVNDISVKTATPFALVSKPSCISVCMHFSNGLCFTIRPFSSTGSQPPSKLHYAQSSSLPLQHQQSSKMGGNWTLKQNTATNRQSHKVLQAAADYEWQPSSDYCPTLDKPCRAHRQMIMLNVELTLFLARYEVFMHWVSF